MSTNTNSKAYKLMRRTVANMVPQPAPEGLTKEQVAIHDTFQEIMISCLKKNADYGSSVFKNPVLAPDMPVASAIKTRMSDKIERLQSLAGKQGLVHDESFDDTLKDLGVYAILLLASKKLQTEEEPS